LLFADVNICVCVCVYVYGIKDFSHLRADSGGPPCRISF